MLHALIVTIHVIVSILLIVIVLTQSGQSADLAAAFGGQGSQTAFGPRGAATILTKATTWLAVIFMITSITLAIMKSNATGVQSVLGAETQQQSQPAKK